MVDSSSSVREDLLLLYELSLSIGQSLDPYATCKGFLRSLMARRNLTGASVWWRAGAFDDDGGDGMTLLESIPRGETCRDALPEEHPLCRLAREGRARAFATGDPEFSVYDINIAPPAGSWALYPMAECGLLLMSSAADDLFTPRMLGQLRAVVGKLATAIQGGIAHQRLQRSEAALRDSARELDESRNLLQTIIDAVPIRVFWKDLESRYLGCNPAFARDAGMQRPEDLIGKDDFHMGWAEQAELYRADDAKVIHSGLEMIAYEEPQSTPDGRTIWLSTSKVPLRKRDGSIFGLLGIYEDITDRKTAEFALRASEQKLLTILDSVDAFIYLKDNDGRYLFANRRLREYWQVEMDEVVGFSDEKFLGAAGIERVQEDDRRVLLYGETIRVEESLTNRLTGDARVYLTTKLALRRENGEIYGLCGISTDITQRKQAEIALAESEQRLRTLVEAVPDAIQFKDGEGRWLIANSVFLRLLGLLGEEWRGFNDNDLAVRHPRIAGMLQRLQGSDERAWESSDPIRAEEWLELETGEPVCFDLVKVPLFDPRGGRQAMVIVGRDITEAKSNAAELERHRRDLQGLVDQKTRELLETEARASHILQSSADGLFGVDRQGLVTFVNPAACRMLGFRTEELVGKNAHAVFHYHWPDGRTYPEHECPIEQAMLSNEVRRTDDEVFWCADGNALPVMYSVHPMQRDQKVIGAVVSFVDVSVQRAAAQAREHALVAAENLARMRSEFLANMSHEIRTPLHGMLGFAQIGLRRAADPERVRGAFDRILGSGRMLIRVIDEILDFSKIEAGKLRIDAVDMSLYQMVDDAVELVEQHARNKGVALIMDVARLPERCVSDPLRLGQVLLNLLSNAVKFTEQGEVSLIALQRDERLVFTVNDTGIGMQPGQLDQIFDPFVQADGSTTRRFGGTGLGLAITRRILELMGGGITASSRLGKGSRFEFWVPFRAAPDRVSLDDPPAPMPSVDEQPLKGVSVLIVEDVEVNQLILEDLLTLAGARVAIAADGAAAVESVSAGGESAYDVVLMDIQMPVMNGYEAARRISQQLPGLPIIGQTAHAFPEERRQCLAAGMVDHVSKPIDEQALLSTILRHLGR